jgi:hypothetical protein
VGFDWELCESGPADAERVALLLPGGFLRARSYERVHNANTDVWVPEAGN